MVDVDLRVAWDWICCAKLLLQVEKFQVAATDRLMSRAVTRSASLRVWAGRWKRVAKVFRRAMLQFNIEAQEWGAKCLDQEAALQDAHDDAEVRDFAIATLNATILDMKLKHAEQLETLAQALGHATETLAKAADTQDRIHTVLAEGTSRTHYGLLADLLAALHGPMQANAPGDS